MSSAATEFNLISARARRVTGGKDFSVARRRYQGGSLFKRGIRRRVWVARWREDVILEDGTRGRTQRSAVLGAVLEIPTRREAQTILDMRLRALNQGVHQPECVKAFRDFVEGEWAPLVLPNFKYSTQHSYRAVLTTHLLPYFGGWRLSEISKRDVQQFVAEKFRQQLAWQTVRNIWIVLSSVLDSAVEYDYLATNPARGVRFPPQQPAREHKVLDSEALSKLLVQLTEPAKTMVALIGLTGMRIGELLALRWRSVDLGAGTLKVSESVFQGRFQRPKSERSVRVIPLGPVAQSLLREHRDRSVSSALDDLIFSRNGRSSYLESHLLQRVLQPAAERANLGRITWHQFRHVHASVLHDLGVPAKVAQKQLGHASVETTLNTYTHVIPETHRQAVERLERALFPNVPKLAVEEKVPGALIQ